VGGERAKKIPGIIGTLIAPERLTGYSRVNGGYGRQTTKNQSLPRPGPYARVGRGFIFEERVMEINGQKMWYEAIVKSGSYYRNGMAEALERCGHHHRTVAAAEQCKERKFGYPSTKSLSSAVVDKWGYEPDSDGEKRTLNAYGNQQVDKENKNYRKYLEKQSNDNLCK
jgi:hypothetical protein